MRFAQLKAERSAVRDRRGIQSLPARTQQLVKKWYLRSMFNSDNEATAVMSTHPLAWHMMIEIDGELAAYAFGFREPWRRDPHLRISQVAFNSAFARYSPGMLGLHELLTTLADDTSRPIEVVDFTRGEEPYKFALGGETHTYATFTRR